MRLITHKTNRNIKIAVSGKLYRVGADGVLDPQPEGAARKEILQLTAFTLVDVETAEERAARIATLNPPAPVAEPEPVARQIEDVSTADFMGLTRTMDAVTGVGQQPANTPARDFDTLPVKPTEDQLEDGAAAYKGFDFSGLSREELYEIVKERGITGCSNKSKADLLLIVMGE